MSSLLQHHGTMSRERGVELLIYRTKDDTRTWGGYRLGEPKRPGLADAEPVYHLGVCRGAVPRLHRIWRKPAGMWGCWVLFRVNGEKHAPDLSTPWGLATLPRDAEALTDAEARAYWAS